MLKLLLALLLALPAQQAEQFEPARFHEGQVWEYQVRPGDEGSLLKIQHIETSPVGDDPIYHISVIGVRLGGRADNQIQHLPVSEQSLNASVTRLARRDADFPSADEGIAIWREERGGVFTIPLAEIIATADRQIGTLPPPEVPAPPPVT
jgi:hypothetical protein